MEVVQMLSRAMELPKGKLTGNEILSEIEPWDSLAILSFMAMVDTNYGITLRPDELLKCESIADVQSLLNEYAKQRG